MSKIKVIGIGSPFGDDSIGWEAATKLKEREIIQSYLPEILSIETHDRPGVRLLEIMGGADTVLLIDAIVSGNPVGTLYRFVNNDIYELNSLVSTHAIGVVETLQLGRALHQLPDNIILYGIEIDVMNSVVASELHRLVECIEREILQIFNSEKA
jgi:hydrogenase maturation protease